MHLGKIPMKPSVNTMAATVPALNKRDTMNYLPVGSHKTPWRTTVTAYSGKVCTVKVRDNVSIFEYVCLCSSVSSDNSLYRLINQNIKTYLPRIFFPGLAMDFRLVFCSLLFVIVSVSAKATHRGSKLIFSLLWGL